MIPDLQDVPVDDPDWRADIDPSQIIRDEYAKLTKVRKNLIEIYNSEFLGTLISQSVDRKDRYKPVTQHRIKVGDIVLLQEENTKPTNYPMGVVKSIEVNSNNEATGAVILKGKSKELVKRHITTLIPLLEVNVCSEQESDSPITNFNLDSQELESNSPGPTLKRRKAAIESEQRTRDILRDL